MIQKIDISNPSIAEEIRKQMMVATFADKGLMSDKNVLSLSAMIVSTGVSGGEATKYIHLTRVHNHHYMPTRLNLSYGNFDSSNRKNIDLVITYGGGIIYKSGNGDGVVGYIKAQNDTYLDIYIKCLPAMSFVGTVTGIYVNKMGSTTIEPEGIVYVS